MDFQLAIRIPFQDKYPHDGDVDYIQAKARMAIEFCDNQCDIEIESRAHKGWYDPASFGVFINQLIEPFGDRFYNEDKLKVEFWNMLRGKYLKFLNLVYLIESGYTIWYGEVLKLGYIENVKDQSLWDENWREYVQFYQKKYKFSVTLINI